MSASSSSAEQSPLPKTRIHLDGVPVFCREWQPQQPADQVFILMHGVESHSDWFAPLAQELTARGYAVFAYDRPGWGSSEGLPGHLGAYADELGRLETLVTALRQKHRRVHLAGLSWGGMFAFYAALRRGMLFDSVSLIAPGICPRADLPMTDKLRVAAGIIARDPLTSVPVPINPEHFTKDPKWAGYILTDAQRTKRVTAGFCFETLKMRKFCAEKVNKRRVPPCALLLAGEDKIIDNPATRALMGGRPDMLVREFPGKEHSLIFECPAQTAETLCENARRADVAPANPAAEAGVKHVVVLGAGAVGSMVGALLANGGCPTTLIGRKAHVEAVNARGLRLRLGKGERHLHDHLCAVESAAEIAHTADLLIVTVKSFDTEISLAAAKNLVGPKTVILSLQNGVGNEAKIAAAFPEHTILAGAICAYLEFASPGEVAWTDDRGGLAVGLYSGSRAEAEDAAGLLRRSGLEVDFVAAGARVKWSKLLLNTAFNALNAATGLPTAEILAHEEYGRLAVLALREGFAVLAAQGIEPCNLPGYDVRRIRMVCRLPAGAARRIMALATAKEKKTVSSMRQDVQRGRGLTEIDEINGAIVAAGKAAGIPTPANERLCAMVRSGQQP